MSQLYRNSFIRFFLFALFGLLPGLATATHIVGGEIELQYLGAGKAYTHRINLNLYFDDILGNPGANDQTVVLGIFRKRDGAFLSGIELPRVSSDIIDYSVPSCSVPDLRTRLIRYGLDVTLNPTAFNDPGGYYISWERCCRNSSISNITDPGGAGSTFYLEFPAISNGSQTVYNSSPVFNRATGDYICLNTPFAFNFSATDPDGDSLVYRLVTPLNGYSTRATPNPARPASAFENPQFFPGPYPAISWETGYSVSNEIPGVAPLRVNPRTGILTVTANKLGLYVFSVEVTEYRKGVAIGLVRRDFQLKVVDCQKNDPPAMRMRVDGAKDFYRRGSLITLSDTTATCLNLFITDINAGQTISVINGSGSIAGLTITPATITSKTGLDTLKAKVCFDACSFSNNGKPFTLFLRATDNGCPQGLSDTLAVQLQIVGTKALKPAASTNLSGAQSTLTVGSSLTFNGFGRDLQNGAVSIQAVGRGFSLTNAGMSFAPVSGTGVAQGTFAWKAACAQASQAEYLVDFIAINKRCNVERRDTTTVKLVAKGLPSQPPTIRTSLEKRVIELVITPSDTSKGTVRFDVFGNDPDKTDSLRLTGTGQGFSFAETGMRWANKNGRPELQSPFSWQATCATLAGKKEAFYTLNFANTDGSCQPKNTDTTSVVIHLKTPVVNYNDVRIPNTITPNGDGKNDFFSVISLPLANCTEKFERVDIYNRWGKLVFESIKADFKWDAPNLPAGVYYYTIVFGEQTFKGSLLVLR
ncbi:gliding motility-associated C-terminal domain-containing protein [Fibrella sp. HMF5335]|uniref:Gliding motility-associated C-terminal domain-containing protein n=1 Tax=Fibrella rubiginis TaxID=2817060 RepID=A0A939K2Z5_9BACT|nr:gliding motility-associated C-terminal domain-containing protein [Fibrella rubiginis]MBO0936834.1 gliding motility-associated C-terminal domain-containing protein [Fibrella rubiginis]